MTTEWSLREAELLPLRSVNAGAPAVFGPPGSVIPARAPIPAPAPAPACRSARGRPCRVHLENVLPALRSLRKPGRPAGRLGRGAGAAAAQRAAAAGCRKRRLGSRGPAPDGRAGGQVRRRTRAFFGHLAARGELGRDGHRQRLRIRGSVRPPGPRARALRGHPDAAVHERPEPQPAPRRGGRRPAQRDHLGAHRARRRIRWPPAATTPWPSTPSQPMRRKATSLPCTPCAAHSRRRSRRRGRPVDGSEGDRG